MLCIIFEIDEPPIYVNFCYFISDTVRSDGGVRDSIAKQRQHWGPSAY